MTDQDGDRAYSDARQAEGSSGAYGAGLARGHQDQHDAVEQEHDRERGAPDGPPSHGPWTGLLSRRTGGAPPIQGGP